ncbi:MAG: hypothetical protein JXB26_11840 [Candidatus Aminicenantes bacterium]|nr:hypothetical protein [Candidatus Aminicenantes bacterium]
MNESKENLVLINAFYTNSIILNDFLEYLNDHFNLYFIDLPGFISNVPALSEVSLESYCAYVENEVNKLNLDHFIMGGISFGFLIANRISLNGNCKGIVAITPYLNAESLNLHPFRKKCYSIFVNMADSFKHTERLWNARTTRKLAYWYSSYPRDRVDVILDEMDPKTFFKTGKLILNGNEEFMVQNLPYVLIANPEDTTIKYEYLLKTFQDNVSNLLICNTNIEHFPQTICKEYFAERFSLSQIKEIKSFLNNI